MIDLKLPKKEMKFYKETMFLMSCIAWLLIFGIYIGSKNIYSLFMFLSLIPFYIIVYLIMFFVNQTTSKS